MLNVAEIESWIEQKHLNVTVLTETLLDPKKGNPFNGAAECVRFAEPGPNGHIKPRGGVTIRLNGPARHRTVLRISDEK